jgi:hypothetical protein
LRFLPDPDYQGQSENDVDIDENAPSETEQLREVLTVLTRHTRTPDDCYFCLWDGWGSTFPADAGAWTLNSSAGATWAEPALAPAPRSSTPVRPKVVVPHRAYFLFHGAVSEFGDWGPLEMWPAQASAYVPDPAFIWPADHAWCVAKDVDPHWAGIGAGALAIAQLIADPCLDVVPADPAADQPSYR